MKHVDVSDCREMAGHLLERGYKMQDIPKTAKDLLKAAKSEGYQEGPNFGAFSRGEEFKQHIRKQIIYGLIAVIALIILWLLNSAS